MIKIIKPVVIGVVVISVISWLVFFLKHHTVAILDPKGPVAYKERNLIIFAALLSLIVVIPVFAMTFYISWKYRDSNKKAKYAPDWDHNIYIETIWWGVPIILITILSVVAWRSSHELDPTKALNLSARSLTIEVVALDWKWLFIYPDKSIASINFVQIPENTDIKFEITSDAPMNSFWIPQLGGQIYAMPGMVTSLHLASDHTGVYNGSSSNISGAGFSGMRFIVKTTSDQEFRDWQVSIEHSNNILSNQQYNNLALPSENNMPVFYSTVQQNLYTSIVSKYVGPVTPGENSNHYHLVSSSGK